MARTKPIEQRGATTRQVAELLEINERHVRELAQRGIIPERGANGWDLRACLSAWLRHSRAVMAGRKRERDGPGDEESNKLSHTRESARLTSAKADAAEIALAELRREVVRISAVREAIVSAWFRVRAHLLAIPSKGAPMVHGLGSVAETKGALDELIRDALDELASTRSLPVGVDIMHRDFDSLDAAREHVEALREPLAALGLDVVVRERDAAQVNDGADARRARGARPADSADVVDSAGSVGGVEAAAAPERVRVGRRRKVPKRGE